MGGNQCDTPPQRCPSLPATGLLSSNRFARRVMGKAARATPLPRHTCKPSCIC